MEEKSEMATKNQADNEWKKKNAILVTARLFKMADADIFDFVRSQPNKGAFVKKALRYYIANGCPEVERPVNATDED